MNNHNRTNSEGKYSLTDFGKERRDFFKFVLGGLGTSILAGCSGTLKGLQKDVNALLGVSSYEGIRIESMDDAIKYHPDFPNVPENYIKYEIEKRKQPQFYSQRGHKRFLEGTSYGLVVDDLRDNYILSPEPDSKIELVTLENFPLAVSMLERKLGKVEVKGITDGFPCENKEGVERKYIGSVLIPKDYTFKIKKLGVKDNQYFYEFKFLEMPKLRMDLGGTAGDAGVGGPTGAASGVGGDGAGAAGGGASGGAGAGGAR